MLELLGKLSMFDNQSPGCFVLKCRVQVEDFVGEILGPSSWAKELPSDQEQLSGKYEWAEIFRVRNVRNVRNGLFRTKGHSNMLPIMICHVRTPNEECLKGGVV